MARVFSKLLGGNEDNENIQIYFSEIPLEKVFVGKSYAEITRMMCSKFSCVDLTLLGFAKYLSDEEKKEFNLRLRNTNYFIQINPQQRKPDENNGKEFVIRKGKMFFFKDTVLTEKDKLIYLAEKPVAFSQIIKKSKGR